ncbi:predicted protein [Chaetoceros tenuissimus]|uniref:Uncharacterized protein n=1 Tax=Chaetoceros tenuissimus TaxID=426638 RepID=A0AAD3H7B0_9STRA|nr:predicted protein [Chaetoceros tenuissimus]
MPTLKSASDSVVLDEEWIGIEFKLKGAVMNPNQDRIPCSLISLPNQQVIHPFDVDALDKKGGVLLCFDHDEEDTQESSDILSLTTTSTSKRSKTITLQVMLNATTLPTLTNHLQLSLSIQDAKGIQKNVVSDPIRLIKYKLCIRVISPSDEENQNSGLDDPNAIAFFCHYGGENKAIEVMIYLKSTLTGRIVEYPEPVPLSTELVYADDETPIAISSKMKSKNSSASVDDVMRRMRPEPVLDVGKAAFSFRINEVSANHLPHTGFKLKVSKRDLDSFEDILDSAIMDQMIVVKSRPSSDALKGKKRMTTGGRTTILSQKMGGIPTINKDNKELSFDTTRYPQQPKEEAVHEVDSDKKVPAKKTSSKKVNDSFESFQYIQQSDVKVAANLAPRRSKRKLKSYSSDEESDEEDFEEYFISKPSPVASPDAPLHVENQENKSPSDEHEIVLDPESIYSLCADEFGRCISCRKKIDDKASDMSAHDVTCKLSNSLLRAFENHGIYSEPVEVLNGEFEI